MVSRNNHLFDQLQFIRNFRCSHISINSNVHCSIAQNCLFHTFFSPNSQSNSYKKNNNNNKRNENDRMKKQKKKSHKFIDVIVDRYNLININKI